MEHHTSVDIPLETPPRFTSIRKFKVDNIDLQEKPIVVEAEPHFGSGLFSFY